MLLLTSLYKRLYNSMRINVNITAFTVLIVHSSHISISLISQLFHLSKLIKSKTPVDNSSVNKYSDDIQRHISAITEDD